MTPNLCFGTNGEEYYSDSEEEAADEYHGTDEVFEIFTGEAVDVDVGDLAPGVMYISETMEEAYYDLFENAPDYTALKGDMDEFEKEFHALLRKYWNKPKWKRVKPVGSRKMRWDGDKLVAVELIDDEN